MKMIRTTNDNEKEVALKMFPQWVVSFKDTAAAADAEIFLYFFSGISI